MQESGIDLAKKLQAVIDTAIDAIITIDHKGLIESLNPAAARLFGYDPSEIIGKNISMLMPKPYSHEHDSYIERYSQTRNPHIIGKGREVSGLKKNGEIFPIHLGVSEVILEDRTIYTGIIHDLSEIKNALSEIELLNKQLEEKVSNRTFELEKVINMLLSTNTTLEEEIKERQAIEKQLKEKETILQKALENEKELGDLKTRFVSMASHEFRTPLTSILSSAAIISRYNQTEQQTNRDKHIDRIKNSVKNLNEILNDFLSLSQLEENKVEVNFKYHKFIDICDEVKIELAGIIKDNRQIEQFQHGTIRDIFVDNRILKNILFNLLSNALKYSDQNIECHIYYEEKHIEIDIKDFGIGIPVEDQKHLFTRFFRASNATNIQGTGLGLNIVKRYVELLNAEINFKSKQDEGSTFKIIIPSRK